MPEQGIIERFRETHHRIAQMFAMGCTPSMIRQQTGISLHRLTLLWNDPSFQELISKYSAESEEKLKLANDVVTDLGVSSMIMVASMLNDRIQEAAAGEGDPLPINQMLKLFEVHADRFGYGKHSTVKHEHDFAAALDRAIARSGKVAELKVIDAEKVPTLEPLPLPEPVNERPTPIRPARPAQATPSFSGVFRRIRVSNVA